MQAVNLSWGYAYAWARDERPTPEQELAVEVGNINGVHVNDIYVPKALQGQVLQQLAAEAASTHAQHAGILLQELQQRWTWLKSGPCDLARACEQLPEIRPSICSVHAYCMDSGLWHLRQ